MRIEVPHLRVISDALWARVERRLQQVRAAYAAATGGAMFGRPKDGTQRKYLLSGLAKCAVCNAKLEPRTRQHGSVRVPFYCCSTPHRKGKHLCHNHLWMRMAALDEDVLCEVEKKLLTPTFIEQVLAGIEQRANASAESVETERSRLSTQIAKLQQQVDRLVERLAESGSPTVAAAIKSKEQSIAAVQQQLQQLSDPLPLSSGMASRINALARDKVQNWRATMRRRVPVAREILDLLLKDCILVEPKAVRGRAGWAWSAEGSVWPLLAGLVPGSGQLLASPTGTGRILRRDYRLEIAAA